VQASDVVDFLGLSFRFDTSEAGDKIGAVTVTGDPADTCAMSPGAATAAVSGRGAGRAREHPGGIS